MASTSNFVYGQKELGLVLEGLLVVLARRHDVEFVVSGSADEHLGGLCAHLLLKRVSGLVIEKAVRVASPGDPLHDALEVVYVAITVQHLVEVRQAMLVWYRPRGTQCCETDL